MLRLERGLSYGVSASREGLDGDTFHAWLAADALPEQTASIAHGMLTEFETLAQDDGTPEEVADYVRRLRHGYEFPEGPAAILHRRGRVLAAARPG